jgi:F-box domain
MICQGSGPEIYGPTSLQSMTVEPSSTTSPFDNVPIEVVEHIFSFIPMCPPHPPKPALSLLHVSRQFRYLALRSKFWLDSDFVFEDLTSNASRLGGSNSEPPIGYLVDQARRVTGLCSALFTDPYFAQRLQLKTEWRFHSPSPFMAALSFLPFFQKIVRRIFLSQPELSATVRLRACDHLEELVVSATIFDTLNLSCIPACAPPQLKRLLLQFEGRLEGSLRDLSGIEELTFNTSQCNSHLPHSPADVLMPISSAETLKRLTLEYVDHRHISIEPFTNLKHLRTKGLMGHELVSVLGGFKGSLETLSTQLDVFRDDLLAIDCDVGEWMEWRVLAAPCLQHLKTLRLQVIDDFMMEHGSTYVRCCSWSVEVIVFRMQDLEDVTFWAGLDLNKAGALKRLNRLRSLQWNVLASYEVEGKRTKDEDLNSRLLEYFREFESVPSVKVQVGGFDSEDVDVIYEPGPFEWW